MAQLLSHLLIAYVVLVEPWLGKRLYRKLKDQLAAGVARAKVGFYQMIVIHQVLATAWVLAIWHIGGLANRTLGLCLPNSNQHVIPFLTGFIPAAIAGIFLLRQKGERLLQGMIKTVGALLPVSTAERFWFAGVSVGAGISEELVFRGFLLYYIAISLPSLGVVTKVALAAIIFGLCHFYQGWQGVVGTAILGAALAAIYVGTGSLLLPMILHALVDLRILLLIPKRLLVAQQQ